MKFKNCLFEATNIVKASDNEKHVYSGYGIKFDSTGSWSFGNTVTRNSVVFCVDSGSPFLADYRKDKFLVVRERPTYGINGSFGSPEKVLALLFLT